MDDPITEPPARGTKAALILLVPAVFLLLLQLLWFVSPPALASITGLIEAAASRIWIVIGLALLGLVAASLAWPPLWPRIRLAMARNGARLSLDRKAARDLQARLKDFQNAPDLISLGELYVDAHDPRLAIPALNAGLELEPENARAHHAMAKSLRMAGHPDEARKFAEAAIGLDPELAFGSALQLAGELALGASDATRARELAIERRRRFGDSILGHFLEAQAAIDLNDGARARELIAELRKLPPGNGKRFSPQEALARAEAKMLRIPGGAQ